MPLLKKHQSALLLVFILVVSFAIRVYGINWDASQHLHPDERFLTMVATAVHLPTSFTEYMDPLRSPLNPYNNGGFGFFVYGTFGLTVAKLSAVYAQMDSYEGVVLIGRLISALADMGTLILVYLTASLMEKRMKLSTNLKYYAAFFYGFTVLAIQSSHFFTTDSLSIFLGMGAIYGALRFFYETKLWQVVFSAALLGLAVGTKISSVYPIPLIGLLMLGGVWGQKKSPIQKMGHLMLCGILYGFISYVFLRLGDPRFFATGSFFDFHINPLFQGNLAELKRLTRPDTMFPPSYQWMNKTPVLFPLMNIFLFGLGLPMSFLALAGIVNGLRRKQMAFVILLGWMCVFFMYQGSRLVMSMRYFYILYPFFAIFAGMGYARLLEQLRKSQKAFLSVPILCIVLIWPISFLHIYTQPHPYMQASEWIYKNIPAGSITAQEHWNDLLPLNLPATTNMEARSSQSYTILEMPVFDMDTPEKQTQLGDILEQADYYIIANNRAYDSVGKLPSKFPYTVERYKDLFAGKSNYELVAEFTSYPTIELGFTKIQLYDQWSDESFTVYDHPRVLIFKKKAIP